MMAMSNKMPSGEPDEIEALLPWHAAGTLNARDSRRVEEALARDPDLARQYAAIREEFAETIALNESLGAPSSRAMHKLFAAIDAEPARSAPRSFGLMARASAFLASLSPRTLVASATVGALAIVLQAGVIGTVLMQSEGPVVRTASHDAAPSEAAGASAPTATTRSLTVAPAAVTGQRLLVRFTATARISDITALLDSYHGRIIDSGQDGLFQLQFGSRPMTDDQIAGLVRRLESEKIVSLAMQPQ